MQLICGQCRRWFSVPDDVEEAEGACPHCGHTFQFKSEEPYAEGELLRLGVRDDIWPEQEEGFAVDARQSLGKKIDVKCEHCGREFTAGARYSGKRALCPSCGKAVPIPYIEQEHEEDATANVLRDESEMQRLDLVSALQSVSTTVTASPTDIPTVRHRRRRRRKKPYLRLGVGAVLAAVALLLVAYFWPTLRRSLDGDINGQQDSDVPVVIDEGSQQQPEVPPEQKNNVPVTPQEKVPKHPECRLVDVRTTIFAADGYLPAAPRSVYWKPTVRVRAGDKPLTFNSRDDVVFQAGSDKFNSFGLDAAGVGLPVKGRRTTIKIAPGTSKALRFVFEAPLAVRSGKLKISGLDEVSVELSGPPVAAVSDDVLGEYTESPPRTLKPLLAGAVMSAIQDAGRHRLIIKPGKSGSKMVLSIPEAQVAGRLAAADRHLYRVVLQHGGERLNCLLRRIGKDGLVLYLSESPFHQLKYQRGKAVPTQVTHGNDAGEQEANNPPAPKAEPEEKENAGEASKEPSRKDPHAPRFFGI